MRERLEHGVHRRVETADVLVVSHCDSIARADTPRSGSLPLPRRLGAKGIRLCCGDTGADLLRQVVPAINVLAGADKDSPAERRHPVAAHEKLGEVAPAVHGSGQETQEGEVLHAAAARAKGRQGRGQIEHAEPDSRGRSACSYELHGRGISR